MHKAETDPFVHSKKNKTKNLLLYVKLIIKTMKKFYLKGNESLLSAF